MFIALYDACVLYSARLRDLFVRLGQTSLIRVCWTEEILDEYFGAVVKKRPDLDPSRLARTRVLMNAAVRDCLVRDYEPLVPGLQLPDPNDRHVLAAAIRVGAQVIVTFNLKDFPADKLAAFGIEAQHPDDFVMNLLDLDEAAVIAAVEAMSRATSTAVAEVLDGLALTGLTISAGRMRDVLSARDRLV